MHSRSVNALIVPPTLSTTPLISLGRGLLGVPLNSICSKRCETPASSSVSYRLPAPTRNTALTALVCVILLVMTRMPFASVVRWYADDVSSSTAVESCVNGMSF